MGGFGLQTPVSRATAAVLHYETVPRVMATVAVRWIKFPRLGYFGNFGVVPPESTLQDAIRAFAALNDILGLELKVTESEWGARIKFLGLTVFSAMVDLKCVAQLSTSPGRMN